MKPTHFLVVTLATVCALGCGSSAPEHPVQPLSQRPPVTSDFSKLSTPEEKIQFIQNTKAPQSAKDSAIAQVRAGKL